MALKFKNSSHIFPRTKVVGVVVNNDRQKKSMSVRPSTFYHIVTPRVNLKG